ncbi:MAG: polysaccharide deacetylase family protein [Bacteroidales bacterium]
MLTGPVKIFTTSIVPRLNYVADLILNDILGLSWKVITDRRKLGKGTIINYSNEIVPGSFRLSPVTLLFESGIRKQEIYVNNWKNLPVFFQTTEDSDLPFDIFAATFFLVSRYEEYLDFEPDEHGRFRASHSLAYKHGFLGIPVINLWAVELARLLLRKYQTITFRRNDFKALLTIDVDEPFAYRGRNLIGNIGEFINDITSKPHKAAHRLGCLAGREKDPYEVFDYLSDNIRDSKADAKFFFPVGDHSEHDRNPSWKNAEYRKLISAIAGKFSVGIHPSFKAATNILTVGAELKRLKAILKREITVSRFHFLKIVMPQSYRNISSAGIVEDYSMGFHDEPGFRAGIAGPFMFYDVAVDRLTNLRIYPFQVMDVTLTNYKKLDPGSAREVIKKLISETRRARGTFISIWHNTTLLDNPESREWREVFEFTLKNQMP